jgi:TolB-like protein
MKQLLFVFLLFITTKAICQDSYELKIEKIAKEISNTFSESKLIRIGLGSFFYNENKTKFTQQLYDDLSDELVALNANQPKFILVNNAKKFSTIGYNDSLSETNKALLLGKEKIVDYIISGKISDNGNGYKLQIRLIETNEGNLSNSFKTIIDKTSTIETLNAFVIGQKHEEIVAKIPEKKIEQIQPIALQAETVAKKEEEIEEKKPKKKRENKILKALGSIAVAAIESTATSIIEKNKQSQSSNETPPQEQTTTETNQGSTQTGTTNNNGSNNTGVITGGENPPIYDNQNPTSNKNNVPSDNATCKAYVNIMNKTETDIEVYVYKENPTNSYGLKPVFVFTIAAGKSKKQRVDKDLTYYYSGSNNNASTVVGGYKSFKGTFEVEACDATVDEEIQ